MSCVVPRFRARLSPGLPVRSGGRSGSGSGGPGPTVSIGLYLPGRRAQRRSSPDTSHGHREAGTLGRARGWPKVRRCRRGRRLRCGARWPSRVPASRAGPRTCTSQAGTLGTGAFGQARKRATGHISTCYQPRMITARPPPRYCLQGWSCISLGVHRKVQIGHYRGIVGGRVFQSKRVSRQEYGLAGGKEPRPDRGLSWPGAGLPRVWDRCLPGIVPGKRAGGMRRQIPRPRRLS
jgi:hypothetical protein